MTKFLLTLIILVSLIFSACTSIAQEQQAGFSVTASPAAQKVLSIHASQATQTWLADAYTCAEQSQILLSATNDPRLADINIRLGEPAQLSTPAFQIGTEDLLIVTHPESLLQNSSIADAQALFTGQYNPELQVWVFSSNEDIEQVFSRNILGEKQVTSLARVAVSMQQMSEALSSGKNTVGILPRHWKTGALRDIYTLSSIPVLAVLKSEPDELVKIVLSCLQK